VSGSVSAKGLSSRGGSLDGGTGWLMADIVACWAGDFHSWSNKCLNGQREIVGHWAAPKRGNHQNVTGIGEIAGNSRQVDRRIVVSTSRAIQPSAAAVAGDIAARIFLQTTTLQVISWSC
jgi:hypothetical protein